MMRFLMLALTMVDSLSLAKTLSRAKKSTEQHVERVPAPGHPLFLHDILVSNTNQKYDDEAAGLTSIKDVSPEVRACFISDLDPEWTLSYMDKMELKNSMSYETVRSANDLLNLQNKAGPYIASMCSKLHIYWLSRETNPFVMQTPPPLIKTPPPLINSPPPLAPVFGGDSSEIKTPPPLFPTPPLLLAANVAHNDIVNAPTSAPQMKVPPPLNEYLAMKTPPPLSWAPPILFKTPPPLDEFLKRKNDAQAAPSLY